VSNRRGGFLQACLSAGAGGSRLPQPGAETDQPQARPDHARVIYHHRTQSARAEGVHIQGFVRALRLLGHEVCVICPPGIVSDTSSRPSYLVRRHALARVWQHVSASAPEWLFEVLECAYAVHCFFVLSRAIRKYRPHLIYDRYSLFNLGPAIVARRYGVDLVTEVNDATVIERSRELFFERLARRIERVILRRSTLIVTVSDRLKQLLIDSHDLADRVFAVTPNAVDPQRFEIVDGSDARHRLGLERNTVIGVVGSFVSWHGLDFLVRSVACLLNQRSDCRVILVGDGPARRDVDQLVERLDLDGRVRFTGFVAPEDVPKYIACMDVCVMPDSNDHGSPIKIFEYMAMSKAVVAPAYPPIQKVIEHGKNGILFRPRDEAELRRAVGRLLDDPDLRRHLGSNARRHVLESHTWQKNVETVLSALSRSPLQ
jgi:glycosyltransferase involved in cell wall biosynthesis